MKRIFLFLLLFLSNINFSQERRIKYTAELQTADEEKYPGAIMLIGNVKMSHEGATLDCKKALYYSKKNLFKAIGEVVIEQGDSIIQYSDFADYNGNTKQAVSWGNVEANDPTMTLKTDRLHFDRVLQKMYYATGGTIKDTKNTLKSTSGTYLLNKKKFIAKSNVTVINPDNNLESDHLEYFTNSKLAYLYGPSTILNKKDSTKLFSEKGFYNTNTNISHFVKNATLYLKEKNVKGDSLYYNKPKGFASATKNIKIIDTIQNFVAKGDYAEIYELQDSIFITKKALAISILDKDSLYMHGNKILVTGKPDQRIVRTFNKVKIFKTDLQGKCDSIHTNQENGLTRMFKNPVLWSTNSQITGDSIQLLTNIETDKLDSLKVLNNAYIIQKDSLDDANFNQIKGRNMYGKFTDNKLTTLWVKGNAEVINFNKNDKTGKLETITKQLCSSIEFELVDNEIESIKCYKKTEGKTYPPSELPEEERKLRGFIWRENERPKKMEDIFIIDPETITTELKDSPKKENRKILKKEKKKLIDKSNINTPIPKKSVLKKGSRK